MKLITRDTDYAVRALRYIAVYGQEAISAKDMVKALKIPRPFLRKIMQILNKKGVVRSYRGRAGGFTLSVPAERIFLLDVLKIFQGPFKLNECMFKKNICPDRGCCILKQKINDIEKRVFNDLHKISIASLIKKES